MPRPYTEQTTAEEVAQDFSGAIKGKKVLVTGGTTGGIGIAFAKVIAKYSPGVLVITCRTQDKLEEAIAEIEEVDSEVTIHGVLVEFSSLKSVRAAAEEINKLPFVLDVVVQNAGVSGIPYTLTEAGIETHLATNHIAPFLLNKLLLPKMLTAPSPPTIVNVGSGAYARLAAMGGVDLTDINWERRHAEGAYNFMMAYPSSKVPLMLSTARLARVAQGRIRAFTVDPGFTFSNLSKNVSMDVKIKLGLYNEDGTSNKDKMRTLSQGAAGYVRAAFDADLAKEHNGEFISGGEPAQAAVLDWAKGVEREELVWKESERLLGETFDVEGIIKQSGKA